MFCFIKVLVSSGPHCISLHSRVSVCGSCCSTLVCDACPVTALHSSLSTLESRRPARTPSLIHGLMLYGSYRFPKLLAPLSDSVGKVLGKAAGVHATKAITVLARLKYVV